LLEDGKIADLYELEVSRAISRLPFVLLPLAIILLILIFGIITLVR
jgi:type II secretory pathway component PulF